MFTFTALESETERKGNNPKYMSLEHDKVSKKRMNWLPINHKLGFIYITSLNKRSLLSHKNTKITFSNLINSFVRKITPTRYLKISSSRKSKINVMNVNRTYDIIFKVCNFGWNVIVDLMSRVTRTVRYNDSIHYKHQYNHI